MISKLTDVQILWSINTGLLAMLIFLIKNWASKMEKKADKMETKIDLKVDEKTCLRQHAIAAQACKDLAKHKHAPRDPKTGVGGEVIL